jgi:hypothetical protein
MSKVFESFTETFLSCTGCNANLVTEGSQKCGRCLTCRGLYDPHAHHGTYPDPDFSTWRKDLDRTEERFFSTTL